MNDPRSGRRALANDWDTLRQGLKRGAFSPVDGDHVTRHNSKTQIIVAPDGTMRERVSLQVPHAEHREVLICFHYLRHYARCFLEEAVGVNLLSRDAPWDFELELSSGDRFFVEITAIADGRYQFEREKREERMLQASRSRRIKVRDLRKVATMFPSDEGDAAIVLHAATPPNIEVANPFYHTGHRLTLGKVIRPTLSLSRQIIEAIDRKATKKHSGKDATVLILDYRGNFPDSDELDSARNELQGYLAKSPFPEIWFYVGYFSDDDGNNAEFAFSTLKLATGKRAKLDRLIEEKGFDEFGRLVW